MEFQHIQKESQTITKWAYGESIELFIFPEESNYSERQFLWRVSSATVQSDSSIFTVLYGVKRWIMPLDATLLLKHTNNNKTLYDITLKPYEAHCFKGEWNTESIGKAKDFNLMLKEDAYGMLKSVKILENETKSLGKIFSEAFDERLPLEERRLTFGLYSVDGDFSVQSETEIVNCSKEELFMVHYKLNEINSIKNLTMSHKSNNRINLVMFVVSY